MGYEYPSSFTRTVYVDERPAAPVLYDASGTALTTEPKRIGFKTDEPKREIEEKNGGERP
jgi:hypothetical protein